MKAKKQPTRSRRTSVVRAASIERRIYFVRSQKVIIDDDLAVLYRVPTKVFNQAVRRNLLRFPADFMFQLTSDETENLRSQFVTSSWGGRRYLPFVFTEQGVAMLSSVLKSDRAIQVNIAIMRFCQTTRTPGNASRPGRAPRRTGKKVSEARRANSGSLQRHSRTSCCPAGQAPDGIRSSGLPSKLRELLLLRH